MMHAAATTPSAQGGQPSSAYNDGSIFAREDQIKYLEPGEKEPRRESSYRIPAMDGDASESHIIGGSMVNSLVAYSNSGIVTITAITMSLVVCVGIAWTTLYSRTSIGEYISPLDITSVFNIVDFVIAFVYHTWLNNAVLEFQQAPTRYVSLVSKFRVFASSVATSVGTCGANLTESLQCNVVLKDTYAYLHAINFTVLRIFKPGVELQIRPYDDRIHHEILDGSMDQASALENAIQTHVKLAIQVNLLRRCKMIDDANQRSLSTQLYEIRTFLESIRSGSLTNQPSIFNNHLAFVFFMYVFAIIPLQMYASVGELMVVLYPVVLYLFVGPIIYRWYIGNPFTTEAYEGFNPDDIRAQTDVYIANQKDQALSENDACIRMSRSVSLIKKQG